MPLPSEAEATVTKIVRLLSYHSVSRRLDIVAEVLQRTDYHASLATSENIAAQILPERYVHEGHPVFLTVEEARTLCLGHLPPEIMTRLLAIIPDTTKSDGETVMLDSCPPDIAPFVEPQ